MRSPLTLVAALALGLGCATPPKPPELDSLQRLRADASAQAAAKRAPDLVKESDRWLARANDEWQDGDLDEAVHASLMGQIKLKQAIAVSEQERAKQRIAAAGGELERAVEESERAKKELAAVNEQVALLERLNQESSQRKQIEAQLTAEKQQLEAKAAAQGKVSEAEIALKAADTVNAAKYAREQYASAKDQLARAQQELQSGNFAAAQVSAEMARKKADEAASTAKPHYQKDAEGAEIRARAEALARDASAIPRVMVRRDVRGSLQRIVVPLPSDELFLRRDTTLNARGNAVLDQVSELIKKYPGFQLQVVGYTDSRGKTGELLALSHARATAVYSALVSRGVEAQRMVASGQGAAEPIADNRTTAGRAQNNRIEIVFMYQ